MMHLLEFRLAISNYLLAGVPSDTHYHRCDDDDDDNINENFSPNNKARYSTLPGQDKRYDCINIGQLLIEY